VELKTPLYLFLLICGDISIFLASLMQGKRCVPDILMYRFYLIKRRCHNDKNDEIKALLSL